MGITALKIGYFYFICLAEDVNFNPVLPDINIDSCAKHAS